MRLMSILLAAGLLWSCTNTDDGPPFFDMDYQLRCKGNCTNGYDNDPHTISHLNGEDGYRVICNVRGSGADRLISASFECPTSDDACGGPYSFEIADVRFGDDPGGGSCRVFLLEDSDSYEGRCTATEPTAEATCQISIKESGGEITGEVKCIDISQPTNLTQVRSLFGPSTVSAATFRILGCAGL